MNNECYRIKDKFNISVIWKFQKICSCHKYIQLLTVIILENFLLYFFLSLLERKICLNNYNRILIILHDYTILNLLPKIKIITFVIFS